MEADPRIASISSNSSVFYIENEEKLWCSETNEDSAFEESSSSSQHSCVNTLMGEDLSDITLDKGNANISVDKSGITNHIKQQETQNYRGTSFKRQCSGYGNELCRQRSGSKIFNVVNYGQIAISSLRTQPKEEVRVRRFSVSSAGCYTANQSAFISEGTDVRNALSNDSCNEDFQGGDIFPAIRINEKNDIVHSDKDNTPRAEGNILRRSLHDIQSECSSLELSSSKTNTCSGTFSGKSKKSFLEIAKRGRLFAKRKTGRLVDKNGDMKISYTNISKRNKSFLADIFTTLLDIKWRYTLLLFCVAFIASWMVFAALWWFIAYLNGDFDIISDNEPCVENLYDFTSALLFSVETQHTIGYGIRAVTSNCPLSITLLMVQSIFGVIIQCVMAGIVFAKLARPKRRAETILFSKNAVMTKQDAEYCLVFRVGDMRRSQLIGAKLHAMLVRRRVTSEGEEIPFHQCHLEVRAESEDHDQFIFLAWPVRIVHRITPTSPFWEMSAEDLLAEDFEIIVVLEGTVESSGMTTQVRTSYLPTEILWGYAFDPLLTYKKDNGSFEINYGRFHAVSPISMPDTSAFQNLQHIQSSRL